MMTAHISLQELAVMLPLVRRLPTDRAFQCIGKAAEISSHAQPSNMGRGQSKELSSSPSIPRMNVTSYHSILILIIYIIDKKY